jgi:hypothetical protein
VQVDRPGVLVGDVEAEVDGGVGIGIQVGRGADDVGAVGLVTRLVVFFQCPDGRASMSRSTMARLI